MRLDQTFDKAREVGVIGNGLVDRSERLVLRRRVGRNRTELRTRDLAGIDDGVGLVAVKQLLERLDEHVSGPR
ncbi:MAG: hypothetical protein ACLGI5_10020 [Thermoleophilia bacterium]